MNRERRCYVCKLPSGEVHKRIFLPPGASDTPPPRCEQHGPMKRDPNRKYGGTKP